MISHDLMALLLPSAESPEPLGKCGCKHTKRTLAKACRDSREVSDPFYPKPPKPPKPLKP